MRTSVLLSLVGAALLGVLSTGGCASQRQLDDAMAANRNKQLELDKALEALRDVRVRNQELENALRQRDAALQAKDQQIALLEDRIRTLQATIDDLNKKLKELGAAPPPPVANITALPAGLNKALEAFAAQYPGLLTFDPRTGMVKFNADLTFEPGSDTVTAQAKEALGKLAEILNRPDARGFNLYICGHTDDLPIVKAETKRRHPNNWYLSVHRAVAVEEIMEAASLAGARLGAMGFGEFHPIAPNAAGHKGNKANRRVEMWIVGPERFLTTGMTGSAAPAPKTATSAPSVE